MKKRILAAVVAAASVLSLAGCNPDNTSSGAGNSGTNSNESVVPAADLKDDDDTLTLLAWSGNEDVQLLVDFYCEETGFDKSKINWVKIGESGGDAKEMYMDYLKGTGDADILFCDAGWAQKYMNSEYTIPMSQLGITKEQYPDAYQYTLQLGTNNKGEFTAPTFQATPGLWVYNAKLAKQYLNVNTPEEMQEKVKDWAAFEATAEELKNATSGAVKMNATLGGIWEVKKSDRKGAWVTDNTFKWTDEADAIIDLAKNYADKGYVDPSISTWTVPWWNIVASNEALGEFIPTWGLKGNSGSMLYNFAAGTNDDWSAKGEPTTDTFVAVSGPQDWYWGGTYFCVSNRCNTKKTAADFIKFYTQNADMMKKYGQKNGDFMNNKKIMPEVTFTNPILVGGQDQFKLLVDKADKINLGNAVTEYDADIADAIGDAFGKYAKGELTSKDEAIAEAKKGIVKKLPDITIG